MAPPRQHHHHNNNGGNTGSPFPPLGGALSNASISAFPASQDGYKDQIAPGDSSSGLPPAPHKVDASQAQACRLQDAYWSDEEVSIA